MPVIQELQPTGDPDEDFNFVVACDQTVPRGTASAVAAKFLFTGPYGNPGTSPGIIVQSTGPPLLTTLDPLNNVFSCLVSGQQLASGTYRGALKRTDPGARATYARWLLYVRTEQTP
jgi:hypothetical protein